MRSIDLSDGEAAARLAEALLVCSAPATPHALHSGLPPILSPSYGRAPLHSATPGWNLAAANTGGFGGAVAFGGRASEPPSPRPPPQTPSHGGAYPLALAPPSSAAMGIFPGGTRPLSGPWCGAAAAPVSSAGAPDAAAAAAAAAKEDLRMGDSHGDSPRGGGGAAGLGSMGGGGGARKRRAEEAAGEGGGGIGGGGGGGEGVRSSRWREELREDAKHAAALVEAAACHRSVAPAPASATAAVAAAVTAAPLAPPEALGCVRRKGAVSVHPLRGGHFIWTGWS
jgi:hypothetical protein